MRSRDRGLRVGDPGALALLVLFAPTVGTAGAQPAPVPPTQDYVLHVLGRHVAVAPPTPVLESGAEFTIQARVCVATPVPSAWIVMRPDDVATSDFGR